MNAADALRPEALAEYLTREIPLSRAMGVRVARASAALVVLEAPLAPNVNHHDTVFGGSATALALLAAWSLLYVRLAAAGSAARLVVQRHTMEHERPITGNFSARAELGEEAHWESFIAMLARRGKARITLSAVLEQSGARAGLLTGEFVALRP